MGLYIDVHCHLHDPAFDADVDQVVERARKAGVVRIVTNGISSETNRHCVEIAKRHDIVEAALGWYPFDALTKEEAATQKKTIDEEIEFIRDSKPIAIGEVGLDYKWGKDKKQQKEHFQKMIDLAKELDIPLIVHSRKAEEDAIEILESNSLKKVVMHCFNGNFRLVKRSAGNGWVFSIPTCINKNEHFQKLVREVNISQILTETDAPYLGPVKDERNEPANVLGAVEKIASIKNMIPEEVEKHIFLNFQRLFL